MWRIIDHTKSSIRVALETKWGPQTAQDVLEGRHCFGAVMDVADELEYLGFTMHKDFEVRPARGATPDVLASLS